MPPWELIEPALKHTVLLPLVVSAAVFLIAAVLKRARLGAVIAVALGFLAGNHFREAVDFRIDSEHPLEAKELIAAGHQAVMGITGEDVINPPARYWLPWTAVLAALTGLFTQSPRMPKWLALVLRLTIAVIVSRLLVPGTLRADKPWLVFEVAVLIFLTWTFAETVTTQRPGSLLTLAFAVNLLLCGGLLLYAHSARLNDIAVMTAACFAGVALVAWRRCVNAGAVAPVLAVLIPGVMLIGERTHTSDVPESAFLMMALSPLLLGVLLLFNLVGLRSRRWYFIGLVAYLVPAIIAVAIAASHDSLAFD